MSAPFTSIIIPARNAAKFLAESLPALTTQSLEKSRFEIIVVNNASTDDTQRVAEQNGALVISCDALRVGAVRNRGAANARGEVFAFLDADCVPDSDWIERGLESLNREPCITGAPYETPKNVSWIQHAWFSQRGAGRRETQLINSGNLFVPRALFQQIGGFNEELSSGEDSEFCLRARKQTKVVADDSIRVTHLGNPNTLAQFWRRELWYGLGALGSMRVEGFDKPLIATCIFALSCILQILGVPLLLIGITEPFLIGTIGSLGVVVATVLYRVLQYNNSQYAPQLMLLYYVYFLARSVALGYSFAGKDYYHR